MPNGKAIAENFAANWRLSQMTAILPRRGNLAGIALCQGNSPATCNVQKSLGTSRLVSIRWNWSIFPEEIQPCIPPSLLPPPQHNQKPASYASGFTFFGMRKAIRWPTISTVKLGLPDPIRCELLLPAEMSKPNKPLPLTTASRNQTGMPCQRKSKTKQPTKPKK